MNGSQSELLDVQFDRSGHHLTVYLAGQLDASSSAELRRKLFEHIDPSVDEAWLDLSTLTYCDATGLGAFEVLQRRMSEGGGRVVLYQPRGEVDQVIALSGLDKVIHVIGRKSAAAKIG